MTQASAAESRSGIQVIERMMSVLDALAGHPDPVSLKQLAAETGLHPSTTHRILAAMAQSGFVERGEPGTYRLGIRLLELGNVVRSRLNIRDAAMPLMQKLHKQIGESVNLGTRQGDEIIYVERTSSGRSSVKVVHLIGARAPLHVTSVGKLYLAEARSSYGSEHALQMRRSGDAVRFGFERAGPGQILLRGRGLVLEIGGRGLSPEQAEALAAALWPTLLRYRP